MTDQPDQTRRRLLAGVPLASATFVLSASAGKAAVKPDPAIPADPRQPRFETTDHIAKFYKLARS